MLDLTGSRASRSAFASPGRRIRRLRPDSLVAISGLPFPVLASAGAQATARRIAERAQLTCDFLERVLGVAPTVSLRVLDRDDWHSHADVAAYGFAHVTRDGHLVVGADAADAWRTVSTHLARHLAPRELAKLVGVHGVDGANRRGPALDAFAELLIVHDVAHLLATQMDLRFETRWLEEAFANYVLVAVLGDCEPSALRLVGSLADAATSLDAWLPTLREFEEPAGKLDATATVLAELAITRSVYAAYALRHTAPLVKLFASFRPGSRPRDADYELGRMLSIDVHPTIAAIPARFVRATMRAAA